MLICRKVLRSAILGTAINIITVMLTLSYHLNCSSHGRWKKASPFLGSDLRQTTLSAPFYKNVSLTEIFVDEKHIERC